MSSTTDDPQISPVSRSSLRLARLILGLTLLAAAGGVAVAAIDASRPGAGSPSLSALPFAVAFVAFPVVGYVLASRRPDNAVSWLIAGVGGVFAVDALLGSYSGYAVHGGFGGRHLGAVLAAIEAPMWVPIVVPPVTFLLLLFPSGHLPSLRWRWFARVLGGGLVLVFLGIIFSPGAIENGPVSGLQNPLGVGWLRPVLPLALAFIALIPVSVVASLVSLVQRFRRSTGIERLQLTWLVTAAAIVAILYAIAIPVGLVSGWGQTTTPVWVQVLQNVAIVSFALIPIAIGVSVLRYRLLEIDLVINRALLFGTLAIFITSVYVAIVVGVGALVGSRADPVLSAVAAAVVALAFQPVRRRAQRLADRLVYGKRASPYEVLSEFSERMASTYATEDILPRMARILAEGTGADAEVWLRVGGDLLRAAASAADPKPAVPLRSVGTELPDFGGARAAAVIHRGELLGALVVRRKAGDPLTPTEEKLLADLASQAALVLRNVRLVEDLRASRQRIVAAQDEERRKIERNLHDGAQQQLVSLAVKLGLLERTIGSDDERARAMAGELRVDAGDALDELRDLARGIYPPLLADKGLGAAMEAQARKASVPVEVATNGIHRYPPEVEATVYFCCLEALNNVSKYARARHVRLDLREIPEGVMFQVVDDGNGFDPTTTGYGTGLQGMADRLDALGGRLEVRSAPGEGTTVAGRVPARTILSVT